MNMDMNGARLPFRLILMAGGCALALSATPAFAETQTPPADQNASTTVEEVVVTAQKREENLQVVPLSVSATTGATIERLHMTDLKDVTGTVPNVQVQVNAGLSLAASYVIRGIGIAANPSPYVGTEVGTVIDGAVLSVNQIALTDQFDVERLEVLRGPQGTLFGANTTGGVVNIITRQPTGVYGVYGQFTVGNYNELDGSAAVNFPIVKDVLAGKIAVSHRQHDGFYTNLYTGSDIGHIDTTTIRGYLLWTPSADFDATLKEELQRVRDGTDVLLDIAYPGEIFYRSTTPRDFKLYSDVPDVHNTDILSHTLTTNWKSPIGKLTSITNYLTWNTLGWQDIDGIDTYGYAQVGYQKGYQYSEEIRDVFHPVSSLEILVGGYYQGWGYYSNGQNWPAFVSTRAIGVTLNDEKSTNLSGFGQFYWDITSRLRIQGGFRVSHETVRMYEASLGYTLIDPNGVTNPAKGFGNLDGAAFNGFNPANMPTRAETSWTNYGGKFGVDFKVTDKVMLYGYYARGFKSGGYNGRVTLAVNIGPYNPEFVDSFEAGIKSDWFDDRLRVNLDGFYNKWKDMQVNQVFYRGTPPVGSSTILNAGRATTSGVELETELVPINGLRINGSVGYLHAVYDSFKAGNGPTCPPPPTAPTPNCSNDYSGRDLVYSPHWTASLSATYSFPLFNGDTDATVQWTYNGERWGNYTQAPSEFLESDSLINANIAWKPVGANWSIALWGRNLANKKYLSLALDAPPLFSEGLFGNPREYGIDFKFEF